MVLCLKAWKSRSLPGLFFIFIFITLLLKINKDSNISQRKLAKQLNLSLGKINYCLIALKNKGFIKINNFKNNKK